MKSKLIFKNEKVDKISTYDQKMRNRLNGLVDRGLWDYYVGPNGEKFYKIKYFHLEQNLGEKN